MWQANNDCHRSRRRIVRIRQMIINKYQKKWGFHSVVSINRTTSKIEAFGSLKDGWKFGGGRSFSEEVIDSAKWLNSEAILSGFGKTDAFPGKEGNIAVTIYRGQSVLTFDIKTSDDVDFVWEEKDEVFQEETGINIEKSISKIQDLAWTTSYSFIYVITTPIGEDSEVRLLKTQAMEVEYPSLTKNVLSVEARMSARTLESPTSPKESQESRLSSGNSDLLIYSQKVS